MKLNILNSCLWVKKVSLLFLFIFNAESAFSSANIREEQEFAKFIAVLSKNPSAILQLPETIKNEIIKIYHHSLNTLPEPSLAPPEPKDTISIFFKERNLRGGNLLQDGQEEIFPNTPSIVKRIKTKHQEIENTLFQEDGNEESEILSAVGQIKAYFKNYSPSYGTGILIDGNHVLTAASCVYTNKETPESVIFFSYCKNEKQYTSPQEVRSISLHTKYLTSPSKERDLYNFTLLTLKEAVPHSKQKLSCMEIDSLLKEQHKFKHEIMYFKGFSKKLTISEVRKIKAYLNDKGEEFLHYEAETHAGSSGAPFFTKTKDNSYYLVGLHIGLSPNEENMKRSLLTSAKIQQLIHLMVAKE